MKHYILFWMWLPFLFFQCCEDDDLLLDGRILHYNSFTETSLAAVKTAPLFYHDKIILFRDVLDHQIKETRLMALDKNTLEEVWHWREVKGFTPEGWEVAYVFYEMDIIGDVLVGRDDQTLFGIDLLTGKRLWKTEIPYRFNFRNGKLEDQLYAFGCDDSATHVIKIDPLTGTFQDLASLVSDHPDKDLHAQGFKVFNSFESAKPNIVFSISYYKGTELGREEFNYLYRLDLDSGHQIFKSLLPNQGGTSVLHPKEEQIFGIGAYVAAYNYYAGTVIHDQKLDEEVFEQQVAIAFPYAYAMMNNLTNQLVKINLITGSEIWRTSLNGHQSNRIKLQGDTVFAAGADGKLYLVDVQNGDLLEVIQPPFEADDAELIFDSDFTFDPETGNLYISDFKHLFCFEFK